MSWAEKSKLKQQRTCFSISTPTEIFIDWQKDLEFWGHHVLWFYFHNLLQSLFDDLQYVAAFQVKPDTFFSLAYSEIQKVI